MKQANMTQKMTDYQSKKAIVGKRLFTADEYHTMGKAGILLESSRIELINGEVIKTASKTAKEVSCVNRLNQILMLKLLEKAIVSVNNPIRLNEFNEPNPSITILKWKKEEYKKALPTGEDALLLIEVADSTLRYDQKVKLPLYAKSGVPEVWIVNLSKDKIAVYTNPKDDEYQSKQTFEGEELITATLIEKVQLTPKQILGL